MPNTNTPWRVRVGGLAALVAFLCWGCQPPAPAAPEITLSVDDGGTGEGDEGGTTEETMDAAPLFDPALCQDLDHDTFGAFCEPGPDCDDNNPSVHESCNIPTVGTGEPCDEPAGVMFDCYSMPQATDGPGSRCLAGTRSCLGGRWTVCGYSREFEISVRRLTPLQTDRCSACNPACTTAQDFPDLQGATDMDDYDDVSYNNINDWIELEGAQVADLPDDDSDGVPNDWDDYDTCAARDGFADGPSLDGDLYPDRLGCDEDPNNAAIPAPGTPLNPGCGDADYAASLVSAAGCPTTDLPTDGDREIFHQLPPYGTPVADSLNLQIAVKKVDIYIVLDNSGSMSEERNELRTALPSIMSQLRQPDRLPEAWFGLGAFQDFPDTNATAPTFTFGWNGSGSSTLPPDKPFQHIQNMTDNLTCMNTQVNTPAIPNCNAATGLGLEACAGWGGQSSAEAIPSALQSIITGNAIQRNGYPQDVPARSASTVGACPSETFTTCPAGRFGYPCFRSDATPLIVVLTDSPIHNGPTNVNVPCCGSNLASGTCMGTHTGYSQGGGAPATLAPNNNCNYPRPAGLITNPANTGPAYMGVLEDFYTARDALVARNARVATVWSGGCEVACRDECRAGTRNTCDACYSRRNVLTCNKAVTTSTMSTPPPQYGATVAQCNSLSGYPAGSTCDMSTCSYRAPNVNSFSWRSYNTTSPSRVMQMLDTYVGTSSQLGAVGGSPAPSPAWAWVPTTSVPAPAAPTANTGPSPSGVGAWSSTCLAGDVPAISCVPYNSATAGVATQYAGYCQRYCTGPNTYRGRAECPVSNPVWTGTGTAPAPYSATQATLGAYRWFWSYNLSTDAAPTVACPSYPGGPAGAAGTWNPAFDPQPTGSPGYNTITTYCKSGTTCPSVSATSTDIQTNNPPGTGAPTYCVPAASRVLPSATQTVTSYYLASATPTTPTCSQTYVGTAYTQSGCVPSQAYQSFGYVRSGTTTSVNASNGTASFSNGAGVCNPPASGSTLTAPAATAGATTCCNPGDPRRSAVNTPIRYAPSAVCPSGTTDGPTVTVTINSGVGCTSGDCVVGGVGAACRCDLASSSNGCPQCSYQYKTCVETCATPTSTQRTTCTCTPPADQACVYNERRASCAPICSVPNENNSCFVQPATPAGTSSTANSTYTANGTCVAASGTPVTPTVPANTTTMSTSGTITTTTATVYSGCSTTADSSCTDQALLASNCEVVDDLYSSTMLQTRQPAGSTGQTTCNFAAASGYTACTSGTAAPQRPAVPGCANVPCISGLEREFVGCRNSTSGAHAWRRQCAPGESLCYNSSTAVYTCRTPTVSCAADFAETLATAGCQSGEQLRCCTAGNVCTYRTTTCNAGETVNNDETYAQLGNPNLNSGCAFTQWNSCQTLTTGNARQLPDPGYYCQNYWDGTCICPNGAQGTLNASGVCSACPSAAANTVESRTFTCAAGVYKPEAEQWRQLARETDSYEPDGVTPVLEQINSNGSGLGNSVVEAITNLSGYIRQTISINAWQVDTYVAQYGSLPAGASHFVDDNPFNVGAEIDETQFIASVVANGSDPNVVYPNCMGNTGTESVVVSGTSYLRCKPATKVPYAVTFLNQHIQGGVTRPIVEADPLVAKTYYFFIEIIGTTRTNVQTQLEVIPVTIVVPPSGILYKESGWYERDFDFSTYCGTEISGTARPHYQAFEWETGRRHNPTTVPSESTPYGMPDGTRIVWWFTARNTLAELDALGSSYTPDFTIDVRADGTAEIPMLGTSTLAPPAALMSFDDISDRFFSMGSADSRPFLRIRAVLYSNTNDPAHARSPSLTRFAPRADCRTDT